MAHKEELAQLITLEQGKPLTESMGEVHDGWIFMILYFANSCSVCLYVFFPS